MDPGRAKELLARERERIEKGLAALSSEGPLEGDEQLEPGDRDSENLYLDELAEARLAAGTYGLSVESGRPIPDDRLEAVPLAERTVEEDERYRRS